MLDNAFLKGLAKSETDAVKQSVSFPTLSLYSTGSFLYRVGEKTQNLGNVVEVIVLGVEPKQQWLTHRAYWEGNFDPKQANFDPPVCVSSDSIRSLEYAPKPQSATGLCADCQWAVPGSGSDDNVGKAQKCKSTKSVYMVFASEPQMKPFVMQVPVTALKSLSAYIASAQSNRVALNTGEKITLPMAIYRCQIVQDSDTATYARPKFIFLGTYLENQGDCEYTTALACQLDREATIQTQLEAPQAKSQIEAPANITPLVGQSNLKEQIADNYTPVEVVIDNAPAQVVEPSAFDKLYAIVGSAQRVDVDTLFAVPENFELWCACDVAQQASLTGLYNTRLLEPTHTPAPAPAPAPAPPAPAPAAPAPAPAPASGQAQVDNLLKSMMTANQVYDLLNLIAACDKEVMQRYRDVFVAKAQQLNGTIYDPTLHGSCGISGMRNFPAVKKDGSFKNRRGGAPPAGLPVGTQAVSSLAPPAGLPVGTQAVSPLASPSQTIDVQPSAIKNALGTLKDLV